MKCIIIHENENKGLENLQDILKKDGHQAKLLEYGSGVVAHKLYLSIIEYEPDLVFTLDLAGFSIKTDTDEIAYINLSCPNVHFLSDDLRPNDFKCLAQKLSIAMFFYCFDEVVYNSLMKNYPEIPYLKKVADFKAGLDDVMREIG
jgi:hypothetical protein